MVEYFDIILILVSVGAYFAREIYKARKTKLPTSKLSSTLVRSSKVYASLWSMKEEFQCARIFLIQFHNGGKFYTGEDIQKFSVSYEVKDFNLHPISSDFKDVLVTAEYNSWIQAVVNDDLIRIASRDEVVDKDLRFSMEYYGLESLCALLLKDGTKNRALGVLIAGATTKGCMSESSFAGFKQQSSQLLKILIK